MKEELIISLEEMRKDQSGGSTYYAWQANIAMAFVDQYTVDVLKDKGRILSNGEYEFIHKVANEAAKNFLNQLIK